jgi:hypothetical protein
LLEFNGVSVNERRVPFVLLKTISISFNLKVIVSVPVSVSIEIAFTRVKEIATRIKINRVFFNLGSS